MTEIIGLVCWGEILVGTDSFFGSRHQSSVVFVAFGFKVVVNLKLWTSHACEQVIGAVTDEQFKNNLFDLHSQFPTKSIFNKIPKIIFIENSNIKNNNNGNINKQ